MRLASLLTLTLVACGGATEASLPSEGPSIPIVPPISMADFEDDFSLIPLSDAFVKAHRVGEVRVSIHNVEDGKRVSLDHRESWKYSANGELIETTVVYGDRPVRVTKYELADGRVVREVTEDKQGNTTTTITVKHDAANRVVERLSEQLTEVYSYDKQGRLATVSRAGQGTLRNRYEHGKLVGHVIEDASGAVVEDERRTYRGDREVSRLVQRRGLEPLETKLSYNADGTIATRELAEAGKPLARRTYRYDEAMLVEETVDGLVPAIGDSVIEYHYVLYR